MNEHKIYEKYAKEQRDKLEPARLEYARKSIEAIGYKTEAFENNRLSFEFKGAKVTFWVYTGWATGKSIKDGRGLSRLLRQIKPKPAIPENHLPCVCMNCGNKTVIMKDHNTPTEAIESRVNWCPKCPDEYNIEDFKEAFVLPEKIKMRTNQTDLFR